MTTPEDLTPETLARALPYWRDGNRQTCEDDARTILANLGATGLCGVVSNSGPNGEPLACGFVPNHEPREHSWATLPTFLADRAARPETGLREALEDAIHALSGGDLAGGLLAVHVARERLGTAAEGLSIFKTAEDAARGLTLREAMSVTLRGRDLHDLRAALAEPEDQP